MKALGYPELFSSGELQALVPMGKTFILYELLDGSRHEIGRLDRIDVTIGRDTGLNIPGGEITLNSTGVSRQHGIFAPRGQHWFFRDLGSTNGSWLNKDKLEPEKWYLLKNGDVLQLADIALEIRDAGPVGRLGLPSVAVRSLIVFSRGDYLEEYPVPEFGRALVIGGSKADLRFDVDIHELPSLVVERRGEQVVAFTIAREMTAYHNNSEIKHPMVLADRDEVRVGHYTIVYNDAPIGEVSSDEHMADGQYHDQSYQEEGSPQAGSQQYGWDNEEPAAQNQYAQEEEWDQDSSGAAARTSSSRPGAKLWADAEGAEDMSLVANRSARVSDKIPFGRDAMEGVNETIAIDAEEMQARLAGYDRHPSNRRSFGDEPEVSLESIEDKIILFVGLMMLLALVGLVVWWAVF